MSALLVVTLFEGQGADDLEAVVVEVVGAQVGVAQMTMIRHRHTQARSHLVHHKPDGDQASGADSPVAPQLPIWQVAEETMIRGGEAAASAAITLRPPAQVRSRRAPGTRAQGLARHHAGRLGRQSAYPRSNSGGILQYIQRRPSAPRAPSKSSLIMFVHWRRGSKLMFGTPWYPVCATRSRVNVPKKAMDCARKIRKTPSNTP